MRFTLQKLAQSLNSSWQLVWVDDGSLASWGNTITGCWSGDGLIEEGNSQVQDGLWTLAHYLKSLLGLGGIIAQQHTYYLMNLAVGCLHVAHRRLWRGKQTTALCVVVFVFFSKRPSSEVKPGKLHFSDKPEWDLTTCCRRMLMRLLAGSESKQC